MILKTGKISKYRSLFFTIFAFSFILMFVTNLLEERGSMALTAEIIANNETPLCPIAIPMLILPAVFKNTLIFPTKLIGGPYGGFFPILFMWLVSLFTLGRGWCSWGCFYGGIDEGFSNIRRKPIIPNKFLSKWLRLVPFIVLTLIVVWSFLAMSPVYCEWLCPLKLVTEYPEINSFRSYLQAIIFISLGVSLLFILPVLTKKRTQCAFFCPLGAFQSLLGKVNPFTIKIDQNKCINCQKCIALCPVMAITENSLARGKVLMTCSKCGKCIEHCPVGAIDFNLPGKAILPQTNNRFFLLVKEILAPGTLFIFTAMVFGGIISGGTVPGALFRIFNLFANGSLLLH
ncbi:MAG: 4Fe-4S binding protein [Candidatus Marinimicrobia bacterium]|nr:4Fe-4S binding protein [Candidatus Neomarinimicrobiota bacterium]